MLHELRVIIITNFGNNIKIKFIVYLINGLKVIQISTPT